MTYCYETKLVRIINSVVEKLKVVKFVSLIKVFVLMDWFKLKMIERVSYYISGETYKMIS